MSKGKSRKVPSKDDNNDDNNSNSKPTDRQTIIKTVQRFSRRGAYCYIPNRWLGKRVKIELIDDDERDENI